MRVTRGDAYALKLIAKGQKVVAEGREGARAENEKAPGLSTVKRAQKAPARESAGSAAAREMTSTDDFHDRNLSTPIRAPRVGSKLWSVLDRLSADAGATIGELTMATGWLEHSTRAVLTGLRRRGYDLSITRHERDGASVYRVAAPGDEAAT